MDCSIDRAQLMRQAAADGSLVNLTHLIEVEKIFIDAKGPKSGMSALHWAAKKEHLSIVQYLVNREADTRLQNKEGQIAAELTMDRTIQEFLEVAPVVQRGVRFAKTTFSKPYNQTAEGKSVRKQYQQIGKNHYSQEMDGIFHHGNANRYTEIDCRSINYAIELLSSLHAARETKRSEATCGLQAIAVAAHLLVFSPKTPFEEICVLPKEATGVLMIEGVAYKDHNILKMHLPGSSWVIIDCFAAEPIQIDGEVSARTRSWLLDYPVRRRFSHAGLHQLSSSGQSDLQSLSKKIHPFIETHFFPLKDSMPSTQYCSLL